MTIILKDLADRIADDIEPSDIDTWLSARKCASATKSRYKNVFGRRFKNAFASGKITSNFDYMDYMSERMTDVLIGLSEIRRNQFTTNTTQGSL